MTQDDPERVHRLLNSEEETAEGITPAKHHAGPSRVYDEPLSRPALDADNMPLPRRVDEIDVGGTRVTAAAYEPPTGSARRAPRPATTMRTVPPTNSFDTRRALGCMVYGLIGLFFVSVVLALIGASVALYLSLIHI